MFIECFLEVDPLREFIRKLPVNVLIPDKLYQHVLRCECNKPVDVLPDNWLNNTFQRMRNNDDGNLGVATASDELR